MVRKEKKGDEDNGNRMDLLENHRKSARDYYIHYSNVRLLTANISISAALLISVELYTNCVTADHARLLLTIIFSSGWFFFHWLSMVQSPYYNYEKKAEEMIHNPNDSDLMAQLSEGPKSFAQNNTDLPFILLLGSGGILLMTLAAYSGKLFSFSTGQYLYGLLLALLIVFSISFLLVFRKVLEGAQNHENPVIKIPSQLMLFLIRLFEIKFNKVDARRNPRVLKNRPFSAFLQEPLFLLLAVCIYLVTYTTFLEAKRKEGCEASREAGRSECEAPESPSRRHRHKPVS